MSDSAVTLLPHPDSPTMPRVSPLSMWKSTPSTARTTPSSVKKCVFRPFTSRSRSAMAPPYLPEGAPRPLRTSPFHAGSDDSPLRTSPFHAGSDESPLRTSPFHAGSDESPSGPPHFTRGATVVPVSG